MIETWLTAYEEEHGVKVQTLDVPALYSARTATAMKVVQLMNGVRGINAVKNIERVPDPFADGSSGKRKGWLVTLAKEVTWFSSLRSAREHLANREVTAPMQMALEPMAVA